MSATTIISLANLAQIVALTLLHFLWQGVVLAALVVIVLSAMHRSSAHHRYAVSVAALVLMACAPIVTGIVLLHSTSGLSEQQQRGPRMMLSGTIKVAPLPDGNQSKRETTSSSPRMMPLWTRNLLTHAALIVILWIVGIVLLSLRTLGGWLFLCRKFVPTETEYGSVLTSLQETLRRIADRMGVRRLPQLSLSNRAPGPLMYGTLRAVIVLPLSAVTGLTPEMLETVIAHELAHMVRHDYLVNMLQCVIETVLFYHPAVWWVSRRIRDERELCCDDLVVACLQDRLTYARALTALEELRTQNVAIAATGGSLQTRIERILGVQTMNKRCPTPIITVLCTLSLVVAFSGCLYAAAQSQDDHTKLDRTGKLKGPLSPLEPGEGPYARSVFIPIEGAGIEITLSDSTRKPSPGQEPSQLLIHDSDLQKLIHDLWKAGARAIAIGNERIETNTKIVAKGPDILVNNGPVPVPFVVRVLGDAEQMTKQIKAKGGVLVQLIKIDPAMVTMKSSEKLTLPNPISDNVYNPNLDKK